MTTDPCACHEQILARLDRVIEILEDLRDARRAPKLARGGVITDHAGQSALTARPGCGITSYCPTHDGRVIAIRDGKPVDVTKEVIQARLPVDE